ncbi:MAG: hypothetical protein QM690_16190 [Sphingobium sp.]
MNALAERVATDLAADRPWEVEEAARQLAAVEPGSVAILFYGSVLRTRKLDDLLDFYVLTESAGRGPLVWPRVTFHEMRVGNRIVRAKVATMPLALFRDAAAGRRLDTTIWTRFCQPCALAWSRDAAAAGHVVHAVASAIVTAAAYAAVLGPKAAQPADFWTALFECTYHTEFRVEAPGRSALIVSHAPGHYADLLTLAWDAAGIAWTREGDAVRPCMPFALCLALVDGWWRRQSMGKALNIVRLVKAAFTFAGAGRYALWKIERHTGVRIEPTRWRQDHPVLAAPGVLWQLFRARPRPGRMRSAA